MSKANKEALQILKKYLKKNNMRYTPEREIILNEVLAIKSHIEADSLFAKLHNKGVRVSRATVYRTLDLLIKCGLAEKNSFGQNHAHYEPIFGQDHHDHLICNFCEKVIEFHNEEIERIQNQICKNFDFKPLSHTHQIFGVCSDCQKEDN
ncbi:MAG: transcriptional repressor [Calditrichaeota bacterium]|nr:MAG: transcriptional repressor [Calditrichota bacterium]